MFTSSVESALVICVITVVDDDADIVIGLLVAVTISAAISDNAVLIV